MPYATDAQQFDSATLAALRYQGVRMQNALHVEVPPNRKEAMLIQRRVDDILDRRPRVVGRSEDGEPVFDNASPWVQGQALLTVVNDTGQPEPVLDLQTSHGPVDRAFLDIKPEDPPGTASGGIGLLDRP